MIDTRFDARLTRQELTHYTRLWCREQGIHDLDLETHPAIDDVVLLINYRKEFWSDMNKHQRKTWDCHWRWTYTLKRPFRKKHLTKLKLIASEIQNNRLFNDIMAKARREKIQALRQQSAS